MKYHSSINPPITGTTFETITGIAAGKNIPIEYSSTATSISRKKNAPYIFLSAADNSSCLRHTPIAHSSNSFSTMKATNTPKIR